MTWSRRGEDGPPRRDQHGRRLACGDLLNAWYLLSLLSDLVRPKPGHSAAGLFVSKPTGRAVVRHPGARTQAACSYCPRTSADVSRCSPRLLLTGKSGTPAGRAAADPGGWWRRAWSGGVWSGDPGDGDLEAKRLDLPDVVAELAVCVGPGLVVAVAEIGEPGGGIGQQV